MGGDHQGAGVRSAHRSRVEANGLADAEAVREIRYCITKGIPPQVRFRSGKQQEGLALLIAHNTHVQLQISHIGDLGVRQRHRRAAGTVINQLVVAKRCHCPRLQRRLEVVSGGLNGVACIGVTVHCDDQGRTVLRLPAHLRSWVLKFVHRTFLRHGFRPPEIARLTGFSAPPTQRLVSQNIPLCPTSNRKVAPRPKRMRRKWR